MTDKEAATNATIMSAIAQLAEWRDNNFRIQLDLAALHV